MTSLDELLPLLLCVFFISSGLALARFIGPLLHNRSRRKPQSRAPAAGVAGRVGTAVTTRIDHADLCNSYGGNTLARVICDVGDRQAVTAQTVLDISLTADEQIARVVWAEAEVRIFLTSSSAELIDCGWRVERSGRWHLLAYDAPAWRSNPDYVATVTLRGPLRPDHAAQILDQLREHMPGLKPHQDQDNWVDLNLALCTETRGQATMHAVSLTRDLGYPVERVEVA